MAQYLFIVARDQPELMDYVVNAFAGSGAVHVIVDRRVGERRQATGHQVPDRRREQRRLRPHVDDQLRFIGYAVVRID